MRTYYNIVTHDRHDKYFAIQQSIHRKVFEYIQCLVFNWIVYLNTAETDGSRTFVLSD